MFWFWKLNAFIGVCNFKFDNHCVALCECFGEYALYSMLSYLRIPECDFTGIFLYKGRNPLIRLCIRIWTSEFTRTTVISKSRWKLLCFIVVNPSAWLFPSRRPHIKPNGYMWPFIWYWYTMLATSCTRHRTTTIISMDTLLYSAALHRVPDFGIW